MHQKEKHHKLDEKINTELFDSTFIDDFVDNTIIHYKFDKIFEN